jgi:hypothetical protein
MNALRLAGRSHRRGPNLQSIRADDAIQAYSHRMEAECEEGEVAATVLVHLLREGRALRLTGILPTACVRAPTGVNRTNGSTRPAGIGHRLPDRQPGPVELTAGRQGLASATVTVESRPADIKDVLAEWMPHRLRSPVKR